MRLRLTKNDSADIGFALTCLMSGAIHFREFKEWLYFVVEHVDAPPNYIFDMIDVDQRIDFKPMRIMGWTPSATLRDDEHDALKGIGFMRQICEHEDVISRQKAIEKLRANEAFHQRVKDFFPFLDLDEVVGPDPGQG